MKVADIDVTRHRFDTPRSPRCSCPSTSRDLKFLPRVFLVSHLCQTLTASFAYCILFGFIQAFSSPYSSSLAAPNHIVGVSVHATVLDLLMQNSTGTFERSFFSYWSPFLVVWKHTRTFVDNVILCGSALISY